MSSKSAIGWPSPENISGRRKQNVLARFTGPKRWVLFCYTISASGTLDYTGKASKLQNPFRKVGVRSLYGGEGRGGQGKVPFTDPNRVQACAWKLAWNLSVETCKATDNPQTGKNNSKKNLKSP